MRPLNLTVEGFTCFSDAQPALDFEHLHLFAIAGPTGAGKSSILDAMMYALYGYVPRLGKAGADLITTGRDRLSVRFEFGVGQRRYRVSRTVRRKSSAKVILEEIAGGGDSLLADKTSEANGAIERLLGIGFGGFSQSIVLPQGRFDTFLRSSGDERRRLLKDLLGLERYELMRKSAVEDRARLSEQVAGHQRLLTAYAHATSANLEQRRVEHAAASELVLAHAKSLKTEEETLATVRSRHKLSCELHEKRRTIESLHQRTADIEVDRNRVAAARRVAPVLPRLDAAARMRQQSEDAVRALERVRAEHAKVDRALKTATGSAREAAIGAEQIAPLRDRIEALNRLHEVVVRVRSLEAQERKVRSEVTEGGKLLKKVSEQRVRAEEAQVVKAKAVEAARMMLGAVTYDEAVDAQLQPLMTDAVRGEELEKTVVLRRTAANKASTDAAEASQAAADEEQSAVALRATLARAVSSLATIDIELDSAKSARMAAVLRTHLHEGESCPVCEQAVDRVPPRIDAPELDAIQRRRTKADSAATKARDQFSAAQAKVAGVRARAEERRATAVLAEEEVERLTRELALMDAALSAAVAEAGTRHVASALRIWIISEAGRGAEQRRAFASASDAVRDAERELTTAEASAMSARHEHDRASERHTLAQQNADTILTERTTLVEKIAAVTSDPDPDGERVRLETQMTALQEGRQLAEQKLQAATLAQREAKTRLQAAEASLAQRQLETAEGEKAVLAALQEADFADEAAARAAALDNGTLQALEEAVSTNDSDLQHAEGRVRELEDQLTGGLVDAEILAAADGRWRAAQQAHLAAAEAATRLASDVARLTGDVQKAEGASRDMQSARQKLDVSDTLARELGGDRFQQYLLHDTLCELVRGASVRLKALTNRYTLEWLDDQFYVVDHDAGRDQRIAHTLSGGETFMASLSLALELSDQILRSAGAVRIDSLFIDEGFGTLDSETLLVVADAIEALQVGGRMVGIITHLEALTERLPGCVRVQPQAGGGSRWAIERGG